MPDLYEQVVISSLVLECLPGCEEEVAAAAVAVPGVEVHGMREGKVVVTIEAPTVDDSAEIANGLVSADGVTGINLVYVNFEDDPALARLAKTAGCPREAEGK